MIPDVFAALDLPLPFHDKISRQVFVDLEKEIDGNWTWNVDWIGDRVNLTHLHIHFLPAFVAGWTWHDRSMPGGRVINPVGDGHSRMYHSLTHFVNFLTFAASCVVTSPVYALLSVAVLISSFAFVAFFLRSLLP
jgi:hypothetical protein